MKVCALCKKEAELIDSHLIPKSAYKKSRSFIDGKNVGLVKIVTGEGSAFYSDEQVTKKLLCSECEDRFSKKGERPVSMQWATPAGFPMREYLQSLGALAVGPKFSVFNPASIDPEVLKSLFYFAISVFWRANVWDWGRSSAQYPGSLGQKYEASFRNFLLGESVLKNVYLLITVNSTDFLSGLIAFPVSNKIPRATVHIFDVLGLKFTAVVGGHIPDDITMPFVAAGSNVLVLTAPLEESQDFLELAKVVQTKVTARGRLSKEDNGHYSK
ncbi:hypothetical protein [Pseudomonas veronii]|uniref:hypothetical protein n=1 Tax=Pseudomonas veronii TaxID=76761 RepID=UPI0023DFB9BF|nr:hypothetical protein [Pseudomonas veronii]MDF3239912.1 hypothetical protein [Pseudomonas veronii]